MILLRPTSKASCSSPRRAFLLYLFIWRIVRTASRDSSPQESFVPAWRRLPRSSLWARACWNKGRLVVPRSSAIDENTEFVLTRPGSRSPRRAERRSGSTGRLPRVRAARARGLRRDGVRIEDVGRRMAVPQVNLSAPSSPCWPLPAILFASARPIFGSRHECARTKRRACRTSQPASPQRDAWVCAPRCSASRRHGREDRRCANARAGCELRPRHRRAAARRWSSPPPSASGEFERARSARRPDVHRAWHDDHRRARRERRRRAQAMSATRGPI